MRCRQLGIVAVAWIGLAVGGLAFADDALPNADQLPPATAGKSWKLVWHDEFDGPKLDTTKWASPPDGARRDALWLGKAISFDGQGHVKLSAFKEGDKYASGCIRTLGKFEHSFGYYVARIQFQRQVGHWSAFWLMGPSVNKIGDEGRDGTEIDIIEKPSLNSHMNHALHWDGYGKEHKSAVKEFDVPGIMDGFHTFGLLWTPEEYVFYVDGKETWRTKAGGVCQVPLFVKLSNEIGPWAGDIKKAKLPDGFLVDYVRVYDLVERAK
jgi:beta-glucanase (GH16 family)